MELELLLYIQLSCVIIWENIVIVMIFRFLCSVKKVF